MAKPDPETPTMTATTTPTPKKSVLIRLGLWTMYLAIGFIVCAKILMIVA
jgi:hypothetical protein